tara:strand:+ start:616 stop:1194 length:579 start_codon:yes stop_codon:yes gene_type:complete
MENKLANNIVYDLILLEADRITSKEAKGLELYYKNKWGEIVPLAEPYDTEVNEVLAQLLRKRKMRYFITFVESLKIQDELLPSAIKILRCFARSMSYGNIVRNWSIRDLYSATGINMHYIIKALGQLCENDMIRFKVIKNKRDYMINPVYFYKGSMKKIFRATKDYKGWPMRNSKFVIINQHEFKEDIEEST